MIRVYDSYFCSNVNLINDSKKRLVLIKIYRMCFRIFFFLLTLNDIRFKIFSIGIRIQHIEIKLT